MPTQKRSRLSDDTVDGPAIDKADYKAALHAAQIQLFELQRHLIDTKQKVLVILEGRDAAGKDGTIKRMTKHLMPRETRIVALGEPSDRDRESWYFQRHVAHLPVSGELVLFNRSWYNRAGVERVMGFCTPEEYEEFLRTAPLFEELLSHCGITSIKYYLDISKDEQKKRLKARKDDPLKQWKLGKVDKSALKKWDAYTAARNEMFVRTHTVFAPWTIISADDKPATRINLIRDLLTRFEFGGKDRKADLPDSDIVFAFHHEDLHNGRLAK
jgi:polyphosphate kinase 2